MRDMTWITPRFAVAGRMHPGDVADLARRGCRGLVTLATEADMPAGVTPRRLAVEAWRCGVRFGHVPAPAGAVLDAAVIEAFEDVVAGLPGPVLAHGPTGRRAVVLWAAAAARWQPLDAVLAATARAGFDLAGLRDDLAGQAGWRRRAGQRPEAFACRPGLMDAGSVSAAA